jgi:hypothetical protein
MAGTISAVISSSTACAVSAADTEVDSRCTMMLLLQTTSVRQRKAKTRASGVRDRVTTVSPSHTPRTAVRLRDATSRPSGVSTTEILPATSILARARPGVHALAPWST